jgi:cobalt-zinc-cadmium efflux system outer membrane protein
MDKKRAEPSFLICSKGWRLRLTAVLVLCGSPFAGAQATAVAVAVQAQAQSMQEGTMPEHANQRMQMVPPLPPPVVPRLGMYSGSASGLKVTLEELEQMALTGNPTLTQARAEVRAATGRKLQSGLWPNPVIGYTGEEIRGGASGGGQQGFFVEQRLVLGGKLARSRQVAEQEIRQAQSEAGEQELRVLNNVRISYYRALAAQDMLEMRREWAQISRNLAQYKRQLFNVGQQSEPEVLQAEIDADEADLAVIAAEHALRSAMTSLAAVVGNPAIEQASVAGSLEENLPKLQTEETLDSLLKESPAVRIAEAGVARAEAALARARSEAVPDLIFRGGLQQNLEQAETAGRSIGLQGFAEVGLELKLFNRNQGNRQAAEANLERARQEVSRVALVLREQAASLIESYATAQVLAERYRSRLLPKAQKAYELIYQRHGLMQASYPQVLMAQRRLFELESEYISALDRLWSSAVTLRGFLLTDGLEAPSRPDDLERPVREVNVPSMSSRPSRME